MNEKEVIELIISEHKWYVGKLPQSTAATFVKQWRKGKARHETVLSFMLKFGYVMDVPPTYKKLEE